MKDQNLVTILYLLVFLRLILTFCPGQEKWRKLSQNVREFLDSFTVAGIVALLLITFVVRSFYIPSESMVPTLLVNDYILVNKFVYHFSTPSRGEIVVFHPPHVENPSDVSFIKRCVAVENDVVYIERGQLFVNGVPINEPYIKEPPVNDFGPYRIPSGHIFMMGDNRNNSDDSRYWGPLPLQNVIGKAEFIFWPFKRMSSLYESRPQTAPISTLNRNAIDTAPAIDPAKIEGSIPENADLPVDVALPDNTAVTVDATSPVSAK